MQHKYYSYSSYFHTHSTHSSQKDDDEGENVKGAPEIKDFKENHTDTTVSFTVTALSGAQLDAAEKAPGGLLKKFKLETSMATTNMNFFDSGGIAIEKYAQPFDICKAFYKVRVETYTKRKAYLVKAKKGQVNVLRNKVRFILAVLSEELVVHNRKKTELLAQLVEDGYDAVIPESAKKAKAAASADDDASDDEAVKTVDEPDALRTLAKGYDYLLSMRLWSLTRERVDAMRADLSEKDAELWTLRATATTDMWLTDLAALEEQFDLDDARRVEGEKDAAELQKKCKNKKGKKAASKRAPVWKSKFRCPTRSTPCVSATTSPRWRGRS